MWHVTCNMLCFCMLIKLDFLTAGPQGQWWQYFTISVSLFVTHPFFYRQVQLTLESSPLIGPTMTLVLMQVQLHKIKASHWSWYWGNYANPAKARPLIGRDIVAIMQISDFLIQVQLQLYSRDGAISKAGLSLVQNPGDHISDTIHHRPKVLYIFVILASIPPPSCIQNTIWNPRAPKWGAFLWVSFIAIF